MDDCYSVGQLKVIVWRCRPEALTAIEDSLNQVRLDTTDPIIGAIITNYVKMLSDCLRRCGMWSTIKEGITIIILSISNKYIISLLFHYLKTTNREKLKQN